MISTRAIGPIVATMPPIITRTPVAADNSWQVEVAADPYGRDVVWRSKPMAADVMNVTVDATDGEFCGSRAGQAELVVGQKYWTRIRRQAGIEWTAWHAPFRQ